MRHRHFSLAVAASLMLVACSDPKPQAKPPEQGTRPDAPLTTRVTVSVRAEVATLPVNEEHVKYGVVVSVVPRTALGDGAATNWAARVASHDGEYAIQQCTEDDSSFHPRKTEWYYAVLTEGTRIRWVVKGDDTTVCGDEISVVADPS